MCPDFSRSSPSAPLFGAAVLAASIFAVAGDVDAQVPWRDSPSAADASPNATGTKLVQFARELLGVEYNFGGRLGTKSSRRRSGIDCQGVLFYALERTFPRCDWRSYSVMPTKAIARKELGDVVSGYGPAKTSDVNIAMLQPGDFIWFVGRDENPAEPAIGQLDGQPVWVWHTALYSGGGNFIVGDHYAGKAVEEPLLPYLRRHQDAYQGILVTRLRGQPKPRRCRRGQKLPRIRQR